LPPSATAPVYKEKVYVKALRMPKEIELKFKNDDYFSKKNVENRPKNVDLLTSIKEESVNEAAKINPANVVKAGQVAHNKSGSVEDKSTNKRNDLHNLINGSSKNENENKKASKEESNDLEFTFHNGIIVNNIFVIFMALILNVNLFFFLFNSYYL